MDRIELLKQLSDKTMRYFDMMGLPPVKCRQLVADRMQTWQKLSDEQLQELVNSEDVP